VCFGNTHGGEGKNKRCKKSGKISKEKKRFAYIRGIIFSLELPSRPQIVYMTAIPFPHIPCYSKNPVETNGWGVFRHFFREETKKWKLQFF
jgi:hypothetical protein